MGRPRLLLLDEPTINLDAQTGTRIGALLHRLASEGLAMAVTSHVTGWVSVTRAIPILQTTSEE